MAFRRVLAGDELWEGELVGLCVAGYKLLLVRSGGAVYAYEDRCAHKAALLSRGRLDGSELVCMAHEWRYDAATGEGTNPTGVRLRAFAVQESSDGIWVDVDRP